MPDKYLAIGSLMAVLTFPLGCVVASIMHHRRHVAEGHKYHFIPDRRCDWGY